MGLLRFVYEPTWGAEIRMFLKLTKVAPVNLKKGQNFPSMLNIFKQ